MYEFDASTIKKNDILKMVTKYSEKWDQLDQCGKEQLTTQYVHEIICQPQHQSSPAVVHKISQMKQKYSMQDDEYWL